MKLSEVMAQNEGDFEICSFEEAGKLMRIILPVLGMTQATRTYFLSYPRIPLYKQVRYYRNSQKEKEWDQLIENLQKDGYKIKVDTYRFSFDIPPRVTITAFKSSDDPEVWKTVQEQRDKRNKRREEKIKQRRETYNRASAIYATHWNNVTLQWDSPDNQKLYDQLMEEYYAR